MLEPAQRRKALAKQKNPALRRDFPALIQSVSRTIDRPSGPDYGSGPDASDPAVAGRVSARRPAAAARAFGPGPDSAGRASGSDCSGSDLSSGSSLVE